MNINIFIDKKIQQNLNDVYNIVIECYEEHYLKKEITQFIKDNSILGSYHYSATAIYNGMFCEYIHEIMKLFYVDILNGKLNVKNIDEIIKKSIIELTKLYEEFSYKSDTDIILYYKEMKKSAINNYMFLISKLVLKYINALGVKESIQNICKKENIDISDYTNKYIDSYIQYIIIECGGLHNFTVSSIIAHRYNIELITV